MMIGALSAAGHRSRPIRQLFQFKQIKVAWYLRHYWEQKVLSGGQFHPVGHGGRRWAKFGPQLSRLLGFPTISSPNFHHFYDMDRFWLESM